MKKTDYILFIVVFVLSAAMLQSCEEKIEHTLIVNTTAALFVGDQVEIKIEAGNGGYSVTSKDENIVQAKVDGSTITLTGKRDGVSSITLKDAANKTAAIEVVVGVLPVVLTKSFTDSKLHNALIDFGLSFEEAIDTATGRIVFTIKPLTTQKLFQLGYSPEMPITSSEIRLYVDKAENKNELTVVWNPIDTASLFSLGIINDGNYYLVKVEVSKSTDNENNTQTKIDYTYVQAKK